MYNVLIGKKKMFKKFDEKEDIIGTQQLKSSAQVFICCPIFGRSYVEVRLLKHYECPYRNFRLLCSKFLENFWLNAPRKIHMFST